MSYNCFVKKFIRGSMENLNSSSDKSYEYWVNLAAIAATSTALLLVLLKLYAWLVTDASTMLASATDSMLDLFASLMNVVILRYALAPADKKHKFGHGKAESLAGLVQSAFVMGSSILLFVHGVQRIVTPQAIVKSEVGIGITLVAIAFTLLLVVLQRFVIKKTGSVAISADALHYQSDLLLNLGVLAALILSAGAWPLADGIFTIAVGLFLLWGAGKIIYLSVGDLMDKELSDDQLLKIETIVLQHSQTKGLHELKTRQSGPVRFIQFHLELDDDLKLSIAHQIGEEIEAEISALFSPCEVLIHHDPISMVSIELERKMEN